MTPISEKVRRMKAKGLRGRRGSVRKIKPRVKAGCWVYRIVKRYTLYEGKKHYFYCMVEYFPSSLFSKNVSKRGAFWSSCQEAPYGETKEELIRNLEMMLKDAITYPVLMDTNKPYQEEPVE